MRTGPWSACAVQFIYSESERAHFEKRSTFVDAAVAAVASSATEADHELVWVAPDTASGILYAESHRWAVESWKRLARRPR